MTPLLGKPLTKLIFVDQTDANAVAKADEDLRQTAITQPAVLAIDLALTRLLAAYGIQPDMTMGHSLGEYGALVASGALPFEDALEAVSARGRGMTEVAVEDKGRMAAVFAPLAEIERILETVKGYAVIANINSDKQAVIGGASNAVEQATEIFLKAGYNVVPLPVSHAFHTSIVAGASEPLRKVLARLRLQSPQVPIVANINGEFYPTGLNVVPQMLDILAKQVASPVQFVKGLRTLHDAGARVYVEVGPKRALQGFADDVLGDHEDVVSLFTNHPKNGDIAAFNQALCGLYAAGLGRGVAEVSTRVEVPATTAALQEELPELIARTSPAASTSIAPSASLSNNRYVELGRMFAETLERGWEIWNGRKKDGPANLPVVITGAALGLPGTEHIFDDANIGRILRGEQFIDVIPTRLRQAMLDKHITRLVKSDKGGATFETIGNVADVIKLAGRGGAFDLEEDFGVSAERVAALDRVTTLAIAVGIDALRDAGIPLVMRYKTTTIGTQLPDRWGLPEALRDDTGVVFASAFPGYDSFADEMSRYYTDHARHEQLAMLQRLLARVGEANGHSILAKELDQRIDELSAAIEKEPYVFDRRFLFRTLSMGHSQFAEFIGARGPNTQINSACASTTQAVALAEDWIHAGRCRRVIVISADDVTSDHLMEWMGAGFLASGAAATDDVVEEAAIPFDRRRHGLIVGMGAAALVVESAEAARERGIQPICEVLSAVTANSAFHGSRLDVQHIGQVMEDLMTRAETHCGISRHEIAPKTVFVSHETYTPARGGSASAEIFALRRVFGADADRIVIANTKGFTGHAMGTGIEDVVAVKALETGWVPPVANFKEVDPELGALNLSKGSVYPVEYALRLGAGFGSQISMTLFHWLPTKDGVRARPNALGYAYRVVDWAAWNAWLSSIAGHPAAELEVVRHTLRVRDKVPATRPAEVAREPENLPAPTKKAAIAVPQPTKAAATAQPPVTPPKSAVVEPKVAAQTVASATSLKSAMTHDPVIEKILALVSEKTGYPPDMLDLDLDLEADLGVDTVKQAEVFAAIRELYNIPRDENRKLRDYPTLAHVIRFVHEKRPDLTEATLPAPAAELKEEIKPIAAPPTAPAAPAARLDATDAVKERILALVVEKTGYPKDMLDLDLDLEADLGVDTVKQAEMFAAIREIYNIPRDENRKLRDYPTLAHVIRFVYEKRPDLAASAVLPTDVSVVSAPISVEMPANTDELIKEKVLQIVAEKTGYPIDMLDLDLDLEADLGIDTVKQAEMFASVRAAFNIPRDENLKLRDFPTLARVIQFAKDGRPVLANAHAQASPMVQAKTAFLVEEKTDTTLSSASTPVKKARPTPVPFDAANAIPRRVPVATLRPPLNLCKPTGVTLGPGKRVVIMPDKSGVVEVLTKRLQSKDVEVLQIDPAWDAETLAIHLKKWMAAGSVHGVYWLPALDDEGKLSEMDLATWHEALRVRIKCLYTTTRVLYEQVGAQGTFLVTGTRLGGQHGYDEAGATAPLGGAVVGFTKTYKRERPDALAKAVDFTMESLTPEIAELLLEETLRDPGAVEIGYKLGLRWTVGLQEQPATDGQPGMTLDKDSVFLISGAAGSIVSAITADLAAASGGTFYLLDLVQEPKPDDPDLKRFVSDKEGLKRDLFARIQARGERATPAAVEKELSTLERKVAARSAIDSVIASGGVAHYFAVNLTDAEAVARVVSQVREHSGHIDVLLHAAGIERSHFLPDKDPREFDLVFDVKTDGWFNLVRAIGEMPLGATVAFSSIAGRFGNAGQTDYSSANDLLCKISSSFRTTRPGTRAIAVDWTAWGGIGMATRGSIPKMMELAGIDMLPPEAGIPLIRRELTMGGTRGEIVIGQRLGMLMNEWDVNGGLDPVAAAASAGKDALALGPMIGAITGMGLYNGLTIETTLDPTIQPFLHDHQIDGTPVLPGVMGVEAFAEAASCMLPGWHVAAIEEVNFLAPFKFYRNEPRTLTIKAVFHSAGDVVVADCQLQGHRSLPNQAEAQVTTHFTARVRLAKNPQESQISRAPITQADSVIEAADIYRIYFHGPAYQVLARAWRDGEQIVGQFSKNLPNNHFPTEKSTLMAPRLIELCFQIVGLGEMSARSQMGLPHHIEQVRAWNPGDLVEAELYGVVTPDPNKECFNAEVVDSAGNRYIQLSGYRTVALPNRVDIEPLKALQAVAV
jgi:malonyl CoA-acyl carrier protein transacylase/3-oxoacyl-(acyl-carrier-protein) synthase/NAD(P)-dependent dehydrogenase (short-subunit alcohol dehydrogenase family)